MNLRLVSTALALCLLSLPGEKTARAQPSLVLDLTRFKAFSWRNIGPQRGGRSLGCTGSPGRPNEYYFGATGGGLWKTTDGGNT